ncbi:hypothetical protein DFH06DRAFT_1324657 [Mycena polygramma]|nr:hypothetical protein DFH06DRAFT_1324657 [Mycena polygramma]
MHGPLTQLCLRLYAAFESGAIPLRAPLDFNGRHRIRPLLQQELRAFSAGLPRTNRTGSLMESVVLSMGRRRGHPFFDSVQSARAFPSSPSLPIREQNTALGIEGAHAECDFLAQAPTLTGEELDWYVAKALVAYAGIVHMCNLITGTKPPRTATACYTDGHPPQIALATSTPSSGANKVNLAEDRERDLYAVTGGLELGPQRMSHMANRARGACGEPVTFLQMLNIIRIAIQSRTLVHTTAMSISRLSKSTEVGGVPLYITALRAKSRSEFYEILRNHNVFTPMCVNCEELSDILFGFAMMVDVGLRQRRGIEEGGILGGDSEEM